MLIPFLLTYAHTPLCAEKVQFVSTMRQLVQYKLILFPKGWEIIVPNIQSFHYKIEFSVSIQAFHHSNSCLTWILAAPKKKILRQLVFWYYLLVLRIILGSAPFVLGHICDKISRAASLSSSQGLWKGWCSCRCYSTGNCIRTGWCTSTWGSIFDHTIKSWFWPCKWWLTRKNWEAILKEDDFFLIYTDMLLHLLCIVYEQQCQWQSLLKCTMLIQCRSHLRQVEGGDKLNIHTACNVGCQDYFGEELVF